MKKNGFFNKAISLGAAYSLVLAPLLQAVPAMAQNGSVLTTPVTPMELPIEVEIELSPAGSLKQALLWKELAELLENPYAEVCPPDDPATPLTDESNYCVSTIERRPGFGVAMPDIKTYALKYNFLTGQTMRLRTSNGEVSWDVPGPLFAPNENVATDDFSSPTELRTIIGYLVACPTPGYGNPGGQLQACASAPDGSLVISRRPPEGGGTLPGSNVLPGHGTVVAVPAVVDGVLQELAGTSTIATVDIEELETPINEIDFLREEGDTTGVEDLVALGYPTGREAAEVLGKALFWDMQVGSDSVQACASCHFTGGADNRTKGQLNSGVNAGDLTLQVVGPNTDVTAADFPFHKLADPEIVDEATNCGHAGQLACPDADLISDANDVMSSMGVSEFKVFQDIPAIGTFLPAVNGVASLPPDTGLIEPDPVPVNQGLRRIEPRNTPTFHGAAFNFDNFWDGRARFFFNGGSVFGPSDHQAHIFIDTDSGLEGATNGHIRPELLAEDPEVAEQPVRISFSSLASQAVGPPLSDFEMSFLGRNWAKIGKKLLQANVTPLANQMVDPTDSVLGPFANPAGPGLTITYNDLIKLAFRTDLWSNTNNQHFNGTAAVCTAPAVNGVLTPAGCDPFDGYVLAVADDPAAADNTDQFTQMEANMSLFFGLSVQTYEQLTIPDDTLADQFFDVNPFAGHGVGEPGDQAVLFPTLITDLLDDGQLNGTYGGTVTLVPGFGPDELFGFDLFAGANLTAALPPDTVDPISGRNRNPTHTIETVDVDGIPTGVTVDINVGSNPFTRSAKCMLCHLGPEQTDHSINISHGVLKNDAEFEYPTPPYAIDPNCLFGVDPFASDLLGMEVCTVPSPEPSGSSRTVGGLIGAEEVAEGPAQDAVEVEPRGFATFDDPATPWDDRIIAQPRNFAFGDQGVYNIGVRPGLEDIGRMGPDVFGWTLSLSALTLKNIGGQDFEPNDSQFENNVMANFNPFDIGATFEETGDGVLYPGNPPRTLQSVNPGFERSPMVPLMPEYLAPWVHSLPAGELHPQIDEMAGMVPNTLTPPNGGPAIEFPEVIFGADLHCALYDPNLFGFGPPSFGWGPTIPGDSACPNNQSGVAGNMDFPIHGTWPVPNRVIREGAFKAPPLRNVELTGPFFHAGNFLTLRQVVDFYFRGGDFPVTNAENRDPNINDLDAQSFSFGPSKGTFGGFDLASYFDCIPGAPDILDPLTPEQDCGYFNFLAGSFGDGLPDTVFLYDEYPDSDHPFTPEPVFASRDAAMEDAKNAIVKFLLALTDPRVKFERAPFDHPELFVPIDGNAPENTGGPSQLVAQSGVPCPDDGLLINPGPICFKQVPAVGFGGSVTPVSSFLGVTSIPPGQPGYNCSEAAGPVSHFCAEVTP